MNNYDLTAIYNAQTIEEALRVSGNYGQGKTHSVREAFIRDVFGPRATGGFFHATHRNVQAKFIKAFEAAQANQ